MKSIEAPNIDDEHGVPFQIFYGVSGNTHNFWSIANARKIIGYAPDDDTPSLQTPDGSPIAVDTLFRVKGFGYVLDPLSHGRCSGGAGIEASPIECAIGGPHAMDSMEELSHHGTHGLHFL